MKFISIISLTILLVGCSIHTPMQVEHLEVPMEFKESIKIHNSGLKNSWWKNFNDEKLNELVELALQNNLNYKMALENVELAEDYEEKSLFNPLSALFHGGEGLEAKEDTLEAKSKIVKLALISEVTDLYFKIASVNANIDNVSKQQKIVSLLLKIAETQHGVGYIDSTNLRDIRIKENSIKNELKNLKKQQKIHINALANLLGQYPEDFHTQINPANTDIAFQKLIPDAEPKQVLSDRPDIQVAYLQVKYSDQTRYEQAMLNYKNTVHNAFQEIDDAFLAFKEDHESLLVVKAIVKDSANDYKSAQIQYESGQIDYATCLSFELGLLQKEYELSQQNLLLYEDIIQFYKTLGLGTDG
jgi:multidrug efflux system outer membrane protein